MDTKLENLKRIIPSHRASDENRRKERELRKKLLEKKSSSRETSKSLESRKGDMGRRIVNKIKKGKNEIKQGEPENDVEPGEILEHRNSRTRRNKFVRKKRLIHIKEDQTRDIRTKVKFRVIRTKPNKTITNLSYKERTSTNGKKQKSVSARSFPSSTGNVVKSTLPPLVRKSASSSVVSNSSTPSSRSSTSPTSRKHRFSLSITKPFDAKINERQRSVSALPKSTAHKRTKSSNELSLNVETFLLTQTGSSGRTTSKTTITSRRVVIASSKSNKTQRSSHRSSNRKIYARDDRINHDFIVNRAGKSTNKNQTNFNKKASFDECDLEKSDVNEQTIGKVFEQRNLQSPGHQDSSHDRKVTLRPDNYGGASLSPISRSPSKIIDSVKTNSSSPNSFKVRTILNSRTQSGALDTVSNRENERKVSKKRVRIRPARRSPSISGARSIKSSPSDKSNRGFSSSSDEEESHRSRKFSSSSSASRPKKRRRKRYRRSRSRTRSPVLVIEKPLSLSHSRERSDKIDFFQSSNSIQSARAPKGYPNGERLKKRNIKGTSFEKFECIAKVQADVLRHKQQIIEAEKNPRSSGEFSGSLGTSSSRSNSTNIIRKQPGIFGELKNDAGRQSEGLATICYSPAFGPKVNKPPRAPQKGDSPRTPLSCNLEDSELMLEVTGKDVSVLRAQTETVSDQKKQSERRKRMLEWKKRKRRVIVSESQKRRKLNSSEPCTISAKSTSSTMPTADLSAFSTTGLEDDFSGGENIEGVAQDKPSQPTSYTISTSDETGDKRKKDVEDEITADEWDVSKYGCRRLEPHYTIRNLLDSGTYGTVFRATCNKTGEIYALKKIKMHQSKDGFPITSLRELALLMEIDHQNVVKAIEIVVSKRNIRDIFMVMEFCDHDFGALLKIKKQPFALSELKCLMQQLLSGLSYMHANWMLHRDLKPSNLLLNSKGILKICDFGMARRYGSPIEPYTPNCCTLWYQSPEMLMGVKTYTTAVDCWAVGVIMAQLVLGRALFTGGTAFAQLKEILKILGTPDESTPGWNDLEEVKKWKFKFYTPSLHSLFMPKGPTLTQLCRLSSEGFNCLNKLLQWDPTMRLTASEALKHDWFVETPRPCTPDLLPTFPKLNEQKRSRAIKQYKSDMKLKEQMLREKGGFHMGV